MSERELRLQGNNDGGADGAEPDGPDVGRLLNIRRQGEAFSAAAGRACNFALQSGLSAHELLHSIHNTSGE